LLRKLIKPYDVDKIAGRDKKRETKTAAALYIIQKADHSVVYMANTKLEIYISKPSKKNRFPLLHAITCDISISTAQRLQHRIYIDTHVHNKSVLHLTSFL
jgi:hypothetical protein